MNLEQVKTHKYEEIEAKYYQAPKRSFEIKNLAHLLRLLGALMLFVSAGVYLFQGWTDFSGIEKSLKFLVFSVILSGVGFVLGLKVKEDKGARTLLGTSASFLPVHFAQLGAIIYASYIGKTESFSRNLSLLEFAPAESVMGLMLATGLVLSVMSGVVYLAMNVMARNQASKLTGVYFLTSLSLLVPTRYASYIAAIGLVILCALIYLDSKYFSKESSLQTFEGRVARAMPFASLALLFGRNYMLYPATDFFVAVFYLLLTAALTLIPLKFLQNLKPLGRIFQGLAVYPLAAFSTLIASSLGDGIPFKVRVIGVVFTLGCFILGKLALDKGDNYRVLGAVSFVILGVSGMLDTSAIIIPLTYSLVASLFAIIYGFEKSSFTTFLTGLLGLVITFFYQIDVAAILHGANSWMVFGVLGVLIVVMSSVIEKGDNKLFKLYRRVKSRFFSKELEAEVYGGVEAA